MDLLEAGTCICHTAQQHPDALPSVPALHFTQMPDKLPNCCSGERTPQGLLALEAICVRLCTHYMAMSHHVLNEPEMALLTKG